MIIIHNLEEFEPGWESSVITLGVFDGMHRGHRALIERVQKRSQPEGRARSLVTYHPHPDLVLGKREAGRHELFLYEEKIALYQRFDLDAVIFLPFTKDLAQMSATRYLEEILLDRLRARHIIIGHDQRFGKGREGDFDFLEQRADRYGFAVEQIHAVKFMGAIVSTSRIRSTIEDGKVLAANRLLGHEYFLSALVVRGDQRGRRNQLQCFGHDMTPLRTITDVF